MRAQSLSPNAPCRRLGGNRSILPQFLKRKSCGTGSGISSMIQRWGVLSILSILRSTAESRCTVLGPTFGCTPGWTGSALAELSHDYQTAPIWARILTKLGLLCLSQAVWSPLCHHQLSMGTTSLGGAVRLGTLLCWSLEWSQHALVTKALTLCVKYWILSGDGHRNCSHMPCSPPSAQTPRPSSSRAAPGPQWSMSCSACANPGCSRGAQEDLTLIP